MDYTPLKGFCAVDSPEERLIAVLAARSAKRVEVYREEINGSIWYSCELYYLYVQKFFCCVEYGGICKVNVIYSTSIALTCLH